MKSRFLLVTLIFFCVPDTVLAQTQQVTFNFTGMAQTWVVPHGVASIAVDARGGSGGGNPSDATVLGGRGGRVQTTLRVTPGETLVIYVGGRGEDLSATLPNTAGAGGFNGGAAGGIDNVDFNGPAAGGGGASDVRQGGNDFAHRVVVAGAGGGAECCEDANGGDGGGLTGMAGPSGGDSSNGGGGGTQSGGGAGGTGCNGNGGDGSLGQGGAGGNGNRAGGGGGGGYYGGGGGGGCTFGSGGGGGSSFSAGTNTTHTQGYQTGNGQVIFTIGTPSATRSGKGQITLDGAPMTGVPVLRLNQQLVRQEVAFTDADGNYFFAGVASLDYIMPVSSGSGSQPNPNVGPQGNIFAPEFCQIDASTSPKRCNSNNSVVAENFVAVSKPAPVPVLLFQMPLPAGSWRLATEAGGYVITGGTVDADPSHTDLSSGFYALDFAGDCGTPILAPADGQVVLIQKIPTSNSATNSVTSFGNTVVLKHSGNVYTRYAHLHSISVKVGDQLKAGDQLGLMGSTGLSFGPHLHFQFYDGGFLPSNSQSEDVVVRQVQVENGSSSSSLIDFIAGAMYQSNNASATRTITCNK